MPFEVSIDGDNFLQSLENHQIGGVSFDPDYIADVIRGAIRDTMREYSNRVNTLTAYWKDKNVPVFTSNFSPQQQVGLSRLDSQPVVFNLENTSIWGLVSAGSGEHIIRSKGDWPLKFTGWPHEDSGQTERSFRSARSIRGAARSRHGRNTSRSGRYTQAERQRASSRLSGIYPETYIAATKPLTYNSVPSRYLGTETVRVRGEYPDRASVNHPGFEGRNLTGILLGTAGNAPGGPLADFFASLVYAGVGLDDSPSARLPSRTQSFIVRTAADPVRAGGTGPAGSVTFATARYLSQF